MNTVCVPYRPDTPERVANWTRTFGQWEGWRIIASDSQGRTFGRSQAINAAVAQAGDWDVLVIADSDLLLQDVLQAEVAVRLARETKGYIVCFDTFHYLDEDMSILVRRGMVPEPRNAYYKLTGIWGGMFAIHSSAWNAVGGFDETITAWGGEDGRFLRRGEDEGMYKSRVAGDCYHLKHPLVTGAR